MLLWHECDRCRSADVGFGHPATRPPAVHSRKIYFHLALVLSFEENMTLRSKRSPSPASWRIGEDAGHGRGKKMSRRPELVSTITPCISLRSMPQIPNSELKDPIVRCCGTCRKIPGPGERLWLCKGCEIWRYCVREFNASLPEVKTNRMDIYRVLSVKSKFHRCCY